MYNKFIIRKSAIYDFLEYITGKKKRTIIAYFTTHDMDALRHTDVVFYIKKYGKNF